MPVPYSYKSQRTFSATIRAIMRPELSCFMIDCCGKMLFKERHEWWEKELAHTELSSTIKHSKVFAEKYAEEGDSGVVVVDKGRLEVFIGLLHICWQNTYAVREAFTYRQGYGDKESWWFGFELAATPYTMEDHYGAI